MASLTQGLELSMGSLLPAQHCLSSGPHPPSPPLRTLVTLGCPENSGQLLISRSFTESTLQSPSAAQGFRFYEGLEKQTTCPYTQVVSYYPGTLLSAILFPQTLAFLVWKHRSKAPRNTPKSLANCSERSRAQPRH